MPAQLIVALDYDNQKEVFDLIDRVDPTTCGLKVGSELFTRFGSTLVKQLVDKQFNVFLDLKFHDIPHTVAKACQSAADAGVWMMNVHASGGLNMMSAALKALEPYGQNRPLLIAVTVLTSFNEAELARIGIHQSISKQVNQLAALALEAGLDGVVCSAQETPEIKSLCGQGFIAVTPGIRLVGGTMDDQVRVMTPVQAIQAGSDYLVVGRPITQSADPRLVIAQIIEQINLHCSAH